MARKYLQDYLQAAQKIDIPALTADRVAETTDKIIELQQQQMRAGEDGKGDTLYEYTDDDYAQKKRRMNSKAGSGNADFYLTGKFYDLQYVRVEGTKVEHGSRVPYAPFLLAKNTDALALNKENLEQYRRENIIPYLREYIAKNCFIRNVD